jgi:hypothetical protein
MIRGHALLALFVLVLAEILGWSAALPRTSPGAIPGTISAYRFPAPAPAPPRRVLSWVDPHLSTYVFQPPAR